MKFLNNLLNNEEGATAIEYGLIAALIAVVIIGGLSAIGGNLGEKFDYIGEEIAEDRSTTTGG